MVRTAALACVASLLCAAPALAADQFDLVCTGKQRLDFPGRWAPFSKTYRIDLAGNRWCMEACKAPQPIFSASATKLQLVKPADSGSSEDGSARTHEIDRTTGEMVDFTMTGPRAALSLWFETRGTCEPRPFSGMPTAKF